MVEHFIQVQLTDRDAASKTIRSVNHHAADLTSPDQIADLAPFRAVKSFASKILAENIFIGRVEALLESGVRQRFHKHNTPSFSIFTRRGLQWWRCHGSCNTEGDIIDLVGYLRVPGYDKRNPDHIRNALILLDERYEIKIPEKEPEILLAGNEWRQFLPPGEEVIQYAMSRGLTPATLEKFRVGQSGHYMAMPAFEEGILRGIKMRNINACEHKHRFFQLEGSRLALFNFDAVNLKRGLTWLVKGEIPAMLMDQIGFPQTCAPTGGEGSGKNTFFRWNTAVALAAKIVVGDNDIPGRELAQKRGILFGAEVFFPPDQFKDLDEWILADIDGARSQLLECEEEVKKNWFDR